MEEDLKITKFKFSHEVKRLLGINFNHNVTDLEVVRNSLGEYSDVRISILLTKEQGKVIEVIEKDILENFCE